jgi:hypothetical protein
LPKMSSPNTFWQMYECCYKCIQISDEFLDKS